MKLRSSGILVLFISFIFSQDICAIADTREIIWFDADIKQRKRIDLLTGELSIEKSGGMWQKQSILRVDPSLLVHLPPRIAPHDFDLGSGKIRFTLAGTGQVFELDTASRELMRIDRTFYAGYNFGAAVFMRKGRLHSFGGSGFWNFSKTLTYFNEQGKEWDNIKANNLGPQAIFNGFQGYSAKNDQFFAGGSEFHQFLHEEIGQRDKSFYAFDFEKNTWNYLGDIQPSLLANKDQDIFWTGHYFVQFSKEGLHIIDPIANEVYAVNGVELNFQVAPVMYVADDQLVGYWDEEGGKRAVYDMDELLKNAKPIGKFYRKSNDAWYVGFAVLVCAMIGIWVYSMRRRRVQADLELDEFELKLLRALMESKGSLSSIEVNEILGLSTKSLDNQRKLRVQVIANINQKFNLKYRLGNVILRSPSAVDKRQSQYALTAESRPICQKFM